MRLVAKTPLGEPYRTIGMMAPEHATLLRQWWSSSDRSTSDGARRRQVGAVLAGVAEKKAWIACDCLDRNGQLAAEPPVLFPREKEGVFSLQRGTTAGRAEHATSCPFHWEEGELSRREREGGDQARAAQKRPIGAVDFVLYKHTEQLAAATPSGQKEAHHPGNGPRRNAIQERLFSILDEAGISAFSGADDAPDDRQRLRAACAAVSLYDEVDLDDIVWTSPKWLLEGWAVNRLRKLRGESGWPRQVPMQGFFLLSVKAIEGNRLHCEGDATIELEQPVNVFAGVAPARAPYVALVSAKLDESANRLRLMRGYAHPRYTDQGAHRWSLCPVDSDYERQALNALLYVAKKSREQGTVVTIRKPLFDIVPPGAEEGCRPDFLVQTGSRTICIETMGSVDPEYRDRKTRTHAIMRRIGPVIEDERINVDASKANKILIAKTFAALK